MFVGMSCSCGAEIEIGNSDDNSNDTLIALWGTQFANAHTECGFMSRQQRDEAFEEMKRFDAMHEEDYEEEL